MVVAVLRVVWTTGTRVDVGQRVRLWQQSRWENGLDQVMAVRNGQILDIL